MVTYVGEEGAVELSTHIGREFRMLLKVNPG